MSCPGVVPLDQYDKIRSSGGGGVGVCVWGRGGKKTKTGTKNRGKKIPSRRCVKALSDEIAKFRDRAGLLGELRLETAIAAARVMQAMYIAGMG